MKNLALLIFFSAIMFCSSCDSGTKNTTEKDQEGMESTGFGGEGADPSSGTVISEDSAAAPVEQGSQENTEGDSIKDTTEQ